ncbi:hypothetical protein ACQPYE_08500 [Actinosynnema sp. CA-299493]
MTETAIRAGSQLLYVAVDMRGMAVRNLNRFERVQPSMKDFAQGALDILTLWDCSARIAFLDLLYEDREKAELSPLEQARTWEINRAALKSGQAALVADIKEELLIRKTSMASPWTSILKVAANNSAPVAYGLAGLYGLQRLLRMLMDWQEHRRELVRKKQVDQARSVLEELLVEHARAEALRSMPKNGSPQRRLESINRIMEIIGQDVRMALYTMPDVIDSQMITEGDPRASEN